MGLEKVKAGWENFPPGWKSAGWTVVNQIAVGDTVMNERIDRFDVGGTIVAMPCAVRGTAACRICSHSSLPSDGLTGSGLQGIWKVRDGKICEWRDYAEGSMFQAQLEGKGKDYWPE